MKDSTKWSIALDIVLNDSTNLYELAKIGSISPFEFYRGADLRGINISGQDVTGLNFDGADLRSADLSDIIIDEGALNRATIDNKYARYVDGYDISLSDMHGIFNSKSPYWFLVEFRRSSLEMAISRTGLTYYAFAEFCRVNLGTLRRARRGLPVTASTAESILNVVFMDQWSKGDQRVYFDEEQRYNSSWKQQPSARMVEANPSGGVSPMSIYLRDYILEKSYTSSEV